MKIVVLHCASLVHILRLDRYNSTIYRGDSFSRVDVIRNPDLSIKREFIPKKLTFTPTEAFAELHGAAKPYDWRLNLPDVACHRERVCASSRS